ncbi:hypothetical protein [Spirulina major]|uniref:hypothetical protein n=1 Tax=Spirulina major TaxID=270636 RepID=UPI000933CC47|nr:hypothetical protein [Spirulina major]
MTLSKDEAQQILERLIFEATAPEDWVQDVWGLSPLLGDSAAKLYEAYRTLLDCCPPEKLENFVQSLLADHLDQS